jgi:hypothetical protein
VRSQGGKEAGTQDKSINLTPMEGAMIFLRYKTGRIVRKVEGFLMLLFVSVALTGFAFAQQKAQPASTQSTAASPKTSVATKESAARKPVENSTALGPQKLPLRRVVLYKSGIGYFEHDGHVRGNEDVEIDLTSGQLNDVLKSLTALDFSGNRCRFRWRRTARFYRCCRICAGRDWKCARPADHSPGDC